MNLVEVWFSIIERQTLWVPETLRQSCDLRVFVDEAAEPPPPPAPSTRTGGTISAPAVGATGPERLHRPTGHRCAG